MPPRPIMKKPSRGKDAGKRRSTNPYFMDDMDEDDPSAKQEEGSDSEDEAEEKTRLKKTDHATQNRSTVTKKRAIPGSGNQQLAANKKAGGALTRPTKGATANAQGAGAPNSGSAATLSADDAANGDLDELVHGAAGVAIGNPNGPPSPSSLRSQLPSSSPLTDVPATSGAAESSAEPAGTASNSPSYTRSLGAAHCRIVSGSKRTSNRSRSNSEDVTVRTGNKRPTRSINKRRKATNHVARSSDNEEGENDDSEVSNYEPDEEKPRKKPSILPFGRASTERAAAGDPNELEDVKSGISGLASAGDVNPVLHLPIGRTRKLLSHADNKLLKRKEEGRSWKDLAKMYQRVTGIKPISDKHIKQRLGRVLARISPFTAEEDRKIFSVKQLVEDTFERVKWNTIALRWSHELGHDLNNRYPHNIVRERYGLLMDMGTNVGNAVVIEEDEEAVEPDENGDEELSSDHSDESSEENNEDEVEDEGAKANGETAVASVQESQVVDVDMADNNDAAESAEDTGDDSEEHASVGKQSTPEASPQPRVVKITGIAPGAKDREAAGRLSKIVTLKVNAAAYASGGMNEQEQDLAPQLQSAGEDAMELDDDEMEANLDALTREHTEEVDD